MHSRRDSELVSCVAIPFEHLVRGEIQQTEVDFDTRDGQMSRQSKEHWTGLRWNWNRICGKEKRTKYVVKISRKITNTIAKNS